MAWSTNKTWSPAEDLTADDMNQYVRDQLDETAPAIATAPGRLIVTDSANSIVERLPTFSLVADSEGTTSTSFTDLSTSGPWVTVTSGTKVLVIMSAELQSSGAGSTSYVSFSVSGATTSAAQTGESLNYESGAAGDRLQASRVVLDTVNAGSNTFKMVYRSSSGSQTATFQFRYIIAIPF
jgi:hypothetical protein